LPRELRRDVRDADLPDRAHDNEARPEPIASADLDARALPDADAQRHLAAHDRFAKSLDELH
jgi:hypothetical protein